MYTIDNVIDGYRRNIVSAFVQYDDDPESVKEKFEILSKEMKDFKDLFTKEQLDLLRYVYADYKEYNRDGLFGYMGLSEATEAKFMATVNEKLLNEYTEVLTYAPIPTCVIRDYLHMLKKLTISKELGIPVNKIK